MIPGGGILRAKEGEGAMKNIILRVLGVTFISIGIVTIAQKGMNRQADEIDLDDPVSLCANGGCEIDRETFILDNEVHRWQPPEFYQEN